MEYGGESRLAALRAMEEILGKVAAIDPFLIASTLPYFAFLRSQLADTRDSAAKEAAGRLLQEGAKEIMNRLGDTVSKESFRKKILEHYGEVLLKPRSEERRVGKECRSRW